MFWPGSLWLDTFRVKTCLPARLSGERDGWTSRCDETEDACLSERIEAGAPEPEGGCMVAPRRPRPAGAILLAVALAASARRRRGRPGR